MPFEALVLFPHHDNEEERVNGARSKAKTKMTRQGVVLDLHGGPHGSAPASYRASYEYLCSLGYVVVSVSYLSIDAHDAFILYMTSDKIRYRKYAQDEILSSTIGIDHVCVRMPILRMHMYIYIYIICALH
jgi:hypothetical protein